MSDLRAKTRSRRVLALACVGAWVLGGCAAFNDVVVVDVGEQFRLLQVDGEPGGQAERVEAAGFECDFNATTSRATWFATERRIDGSIRCLRLPAGTE